MIQRYAQFWFLDKGLGIVSPAHFVYDFSTKMFLMLYSINWPNFIAWSPLLLEILGNMCIAIVCQVATSGFSNPDVFSTWLTRHDVNLNIFKGLSVDKNCLWHYSVPLKALFVLKIFKFFSWLFGHVGKTPWLEREG